MRTAPFLGLAALSAALVASPGSTQGAKQPPAKAAAPGEPVAIPPQTMYAQIRALLNEGRLDRAAALLQPFADAATPADYQALERRFGTTTFQSLRNVVRWSDNPDADKAAKAAVDTIIANARKASESELKNPARVTKFVRNLGATFEERAFAEVELRRVGDYAVPYMVDALKGAPDEELVRGIIGAIPRLDASTVAPWLAALELLEGDKQFAVLNAIASRPDAAFLTANAQTDFTPYLWQVAGQENDQGQALNPGLRQFAFTTLAKIQGGGVERRDPAAELVAIARRFADHHGRYANQKNNPDGSPTVPVWTLTDGKLNKIEDLPVGQAEEYYGLKFARMALGLRPAEVQAKALRPAEIEAQRLVLVIAAEKGTERAKFGTLATAAPQVYALLADAPTPLLVDILDQALHQKRTALVLAMTQALGDRSEKAALEVRPINPGLPLSASNVRPPLLVRALDYPDPRVQLAAAQAILRAPSRLDPRYFPQVPARVVQVLRQAAAADLGIDPKAAGQALLVDPNKQRADTVANLFRALGYEAEVYTTGRDLLRRVNRASDYDIILIDHHVPNPQLFDLVSQLRADVRTARRPILVMASTAQPKPPTLDSVLVQYAALIAAADTDPADVPPPYVYTSRPGVTNEEQEQLRLANVRKRDDTVRTLATSRLQRLLQVVNSANLNLTDAQKFLLRLRCEQLTYAVLAVQFPVSPESAPQTIRHTRELRRQIDLQAPMPAYVRGYGMTDLMARLERLEVEVRREPFARKRFEDIRPKLDPVALGLVIESTRDLVAEARLRKMLQNFINVLVIPEPYSTIGFAGDVQTAFADPADMPRDPAEKKAAAKAAVDSLRRIAIGEIPGYDAKPAEPELRAALNSDELAPAAIEALERIGTAESQQALVGYAINQMKKPEVRARAADAAARHVQAYGRLTPATLTGELATRSVAEMNQDLRGKLLVLRGLLAHNPANFSNDLRNFNPPVLGGPPMGEAPPPKKDAEEKKE